MGCFSWGDGEEGMGIEMERGVEKVMEKVMMDMEQ